MTLSNATLASGDARAEVVARLREDLIGPSDEYEELTVFPSDRYVTGALFPIQEVPQDEDDSEAFEANAARVEDAGLRSDVPLHRAMRPSSFGLSFRVDAAARALSVDFSAGVYRESFVGTSTTRTWKRTPVSTTLELRVVNDAFVSRQPIPGVAGLTYSLRIVTNVESNAKDITLVVTNENRAGATRSSSEEATLFQAELRVTPKNGSMLLPRPLTVEGFDEEGKSNALLYRNAVEFAAGHVAAAEWTVAGGVCRSVATSFLPQTFVAGISATGTSHFDRLGDPEWQAQTLLRPLSSLWLAEANDSELNSALQAVVSCYENWISEQRTIVDLDSGLSPDMARTATQHLDRCDAVAERIKSGVAFLDGNPVAREAFQLAMLVMERQRKDGPLVWRPFQLGFQLLALESSVNPNAQDRGVLDLLWFPTGGGKTEAYLGLLAFVALYRRLSAARPDEGAGTAVLMRYTLRLLTTQQFQRAAAVIAQLEQLRLQQAPRLGTTERFTIGLWVGGDASPNTTADARQDPTSARILTACPLCGVALTNPSKEELGQFCRGSGCLFERNAVPAFTIDDEIYRQRPTLLIGTADKFAQITRKVESRRLFALDTSLRPPDLIIQDELHLISGPLGTIAGLYEIAIDAFCTREGRPPKVVGSTATIRRAESQVRALFDRGVEQFPPSGVNATDSGFSVHDPHAPGRVYLGVTTAGRSPKFVLQAVTASLAQSPKGMAGRYPDNSIDPYWTQVIYFNSLRELGGALVLVEDDVRRSVDDLAVRHGEEPRQILLPTELTSRINSTEIPEVLEALEVKYPNSEVDVVLASNMISVGVDVTRLGLMVVNGQPKTTAEYIQATSRIGRGDTPGLAVVVLNAGRSRDRSKFETFRTWHSALYRDVEATSVTPFASRARDRALHAVLVAMLRLLYTDSDDPGMTTDRLRHAAEVRDLILERVARIDGEERDATGSDLSHRISQWRARTGLESWWWNKYQPNKTALLVSAEEQAAQRAANHGIDAWETPNSMREVEPSTRFRIATSLAVTPKSKEPFDAQT